MRFLLLLGLICSGWYFWGHKETYLERALGQQIGHPLSIDRISMGSDNIHLKGVTLYHTPGHPALRIANVYITGSLKKLLSKPLPLNTLTLDGVSMYITYEDRLHHNWQTLLTKTFPSTRPIIIRECMIEGCQVFIKRPHHPLIDRGHIGILQLSITQGISPGQMTHTLLTALLDHAGISTSSPHKAIFEAPRSFRTPQQFEDIRPHLHF